MRIGISARTIKNRSQAFTLVEVVVAAALIALIYGGIINAYILSARRAEWSGYSLAAQSISIRQLETAHAASWDLFDANAGNIRDEIQYNGGSFTNYSTVILDLPISLSNTNRWMATNYFTLKTNSDATAYGLTMYKVLRSDVCWQIRGKTFTNSIETYIAPDD